MPYTHAGAIVGLARRPWRYWLPVALLLALLAACGQPAVGPSAARPEPGRPAGAGVAPGAKKITVVTTMSILADMIAHVGGERVVAQNIIPIGAGPEDYQPTPRDVQAIAAADIVFYNGHGLEDWLDDLFTSAARPGQPRVVVSAGLPAVDAGANFAEGNPHFWLSAAYGAKYVQKIRDGLIQVDPEGQELYSSNAEAYMRQLLDLDAELKRQVQVIPADQRKIVTNHDAFPYFALEYGFTIVGNILGNPEADLSAGDLAQLAQKIRQEHVKAIFSESQFNPRITQTLADEAGVAVIANLYTDTLGEPGSGVTTYVDLLRYDMQTIVEALR